MKKKLFGVPVIPEQSTSDEEIQKTKRNKNHWNYKCYITNAISVTVYMFQLICYFIKKGITNNIDHYQIINISSNLILWDTLRYHSVRPFLINIKSILKKTFCEQNKTMNWTKPACRTKPTIIAEIRYSW